jgi:hypothetical protein
MEAICSCEISVDFQWTTWRYIPKDRTTPNFSIELLYMATPLRPIDNGFSLQSRVTSYEIHVGRGDTGAGFSSGFYDFPLLMIIPQLLHTDLSPPLTCAIPMRTYGGLEVLQTSALHAGVWPASRPDKNPLVSAGWVSENILSTYRESISWSSSS